MYANSHSGRLAEANGVSRGAVLEMLTSTIFDCAIYKGYGGRIARRDHAPGGFNLELGLKDVDLALATRRRRALLFASQDPQGHARPFFVRSPQDTARRSGAALPLGSLLRDRFQSAANARHAGEANEKALRSRTVFLALMKTGNRSMGSSFFFPFSLRLSRETERTQDADLSRLDWSALALLASRDCGVNVAPAIASSLRPTPAAK